MEIIALTTLFSVAFAAFFLLMFVRVRQKSESSAEQDSLIPFQNDLPTNRTQESRVPEK